MAEPVYSPVILVAKGAFKGLGLQLEVRGAENVPRTGGAVLASNHVSYLDFIFAGLGANPSDRYVRFMAKDSIWENKIAGPLMRGMKHIPVDRNAGAESYRVALEALRSGEVVGIFPEATISRSFEIQDVKVGAGVPLIPEIVWGTHRLMTKGRPRDFSRGKAISVTVGTPIHVGPQDDLDEVGAHLHSVMSTMLDDAIALYPQQPSGPDDRWWIPARLGGTAPTLAEATRMDRLEALERAKKRSTE